MLDEKLWEEYQSKHPIGKVDQAKLRYVLSEKVDNPDSILRQAIDENASPDVLTLYLTRGVLQSRQPEKKADDSDPEEYETDPEEVEPEAIVPPPTHPGQRSTPPVVQRRVRQKESLRDKAGAFFAGLNPFNRNKGSEPQDSDTEEKPEKQNIFIVIRDRGRKIYSNRWLQIGCGAVLAIILILIAIAIFGNASYDTNNSSYPTENPATQSEPTIQSEPAAPEPNYFLPPVVTTTETPVDVIHGSLGLIHIFEFICAVLISLFVIMDAAQRRETSDAIWTAVAVVILMISGVIINASQDLLVKIWGFNAGQLKFVDVILAALPVGISFLIVYLVSKTGRTDWTPEAGFLTVTGAIGLIFGTLGALQILFQIPDAAVLPAKQILGLILAKQMSAVWLSLAIYIVLSLGTIVFFIEAAKSLKAMRDWLDWLLTPIGTFGLLIGYPIARTFWPGTEPILLFLAILGITAAFGLRQQEESSRTKTSDDSPISIGEVRAGKPLVPPYDKLSWQLAALLLGVALLGRI